MLYEEEKTAVLSTHVHGGRNGGKSVAHLKGYEIRYFDGVRRGGAVFSLLPPCLSLVLKCTNIFSTVTAG